MNKFLKYGCLIAVGILTAYSYKIWTNYQFKDSLKYDKTQLLQAKLDISSIKIDGTNDIWNVKSNSKLTCFKLVFKGEGLRAFPRNGSLLTVLCNTIPEGAGERDDIAFKKVLEDNSIDLNIDFDNDDVIVSCSCLERYFDLAMDLICDMLTKARLKSDKIEFSKQAVVTSIQQNIFTPSYLANEKLQNLIYEKDHPYQYSVKENLEKAKTLIKSDVDNLYKKLFNPKDLNVTIVSAIDQEKIKAKFENLISSLKKAKTGIDSQKVEQKSELAQKGTHKHVELDNPQSTIMFAMPGVLRNASDRFAALIAIDAFGNAGIVSRLGIAVREKSGLVYGIGTKTVDSDLQAYIEGIAATRPENVEKVIEKVKEECRKIIENGITKDELQQYMIRRFAGNAFDSMHSILNFVSTLRGQEVGIDKINSYLDNFKKLTLKEVNKAIKKIFNPDNIIFVDCGNKVEGKDTKKESR